MNVGNCGNYDYDSTEMPPPGLTTAKKGYGQKITCTCSTGEAGWKGDGRFWEGDEPSYKHNDINFCEPHGDHWSVIANSGEGVPVPKGGNVKDTGAGMQNPPDSEGEVTMDTTNLMCGTSNIVYTNAGEGGDHSRTFNHMGLNGLQPGTLPATSVVPPGGWNQTLCDVFLPAFSNTQGINSTPYDDYLAMDTTYLGAWGTKDPDCIANAGGDNNFMQDAQRWASYAGQCDQPSVYECYRYKSMNEPCKAWGHRMGNSLVNQFPEVSSDVPMIGGEGIESPRQGYKWGCPSDTSPIKIATHPQGLYFGVIEPTAIEAAKKAMPQQATTDMCTNLTSTSTEGKYQPLSNWYPLAQNNYDPINLVCPGEATKAKAFENNGNMVGVQGQGQLTDLDLQSNVGRSDVNEDVGGEEYNEHSSYCGINPDTDTDTNVYAIAASHPGIGHFSRNKENPGLEEQPRCAIGSQPGIIGNDNFWQGSTELLGTCKPKSADYCMKSSQWMPCPDMGLDQANPWGGGAGLAHRMRTSDFRLSWNPTEDDSPEGGDLPPEGGDLSNLGNSKDNSVLGKNCRTLLPRYKQTCAYSKHLMDPGGVNPGESVKALNCYLRAGDPDGPGMGISTCDYQEVMADLCFNTQRTGGGPPVITQSTETGAMCRQWARQPCASALGYSPEGSQSAWPVCVQNCCDNDPTSGLPGCGFRDDLVDSEKNPGDNRETPGDVLMKEWCKDPQNAVSPYCDCIAPVYFGTGTYIDEYNTLLGALDIGGISGPQCWFSKCRLQESILDDNGGYDSSTYGNLGPRPLLTSAIANPQARVEWYNTQGGGAWTDYTIHNPECAPLPQCVNIVNQDAFVPEEGGEVNQYASCTTSGAEASGETTFWTPIAQGALSSGDCKSVRPCDCKKIFVAGDYPKDDHTYNIDQTKRRNADGCLYGDDGDPNTCIKGCDTNTHGGIAVEDNYAYEMCWAGKRNHDLSSCDNPNNAAYCHCSACSAVRYQCQYVPEGDKWKCVNHCGGEDDGTGWPTRCNANCMGLPVKTEPQCDNEGCKAHWMCDMGKCRVADNSGPDTWPSEKACDAECACPEDSSWFYDGDIPDCVCRFGNDGYPAYEKCVDDHEDAGRFSCKPDPDSSSGYSCQPDKGSQMRRDECFKECGGGWECDRETKKCHVVKDGTRFTSEQVCVFDCLKDTVYEKIGGKVWNNKFLVLSIIVIGVILISTYFHSPKNKRSNMMGKRGKLGRSSKWNGLFKIRL